MATVGLYCQRGAFAEASRPQYFGGTKAVKTQVPHYLVMYLLCRFSCEHLVNEKKKYFWQKIFEIFIAQLNLMC